MQSSLSDPTKMWIAGFVIAVLITHFLSAHLFFKKHLETIEFYLAEIDTVCMHLWFYGNSRFGRRMRRTFISMIVILPGSLKKQEVIPRYKIEKLPYRFRIWITVFWLSDALIFTALIGFAISKHL